jgi:hypothetical protein
MAWSLPHMTRISTVNNSSAVYSPRADLYTLIWTLLGSSYE